MRWWKTWTRPSSSAALAPVYAEFEKQFGKANIDRIRNFK
jgi:hypothetical protein